MAMIKEGTVDFGAAIEVLKTMIRSDPEIHACKLMLPCQVDLIVHEDSSDMGGSIVLNVGDGVKLTTVGGSWEKPYLFMNYAGRNVGVRIGDIVAKLMVTEMGLPLSEVIEFEFKVRHGRDWIGKTDAEIWRDRPKKVFIAPPLPFDAPLVPDEAMLAWVELNSGVGEF